MPAWPTNISLLKLAGTLPRNDQWSIGVYLYDGGQDIGGAVVDGKSILQTIQEWAVTWFTSSSSLISQSARLTSVKLNQIGTNGRYKNPVTHELFVSGGAGVAGGVGTPVWQHLSVAITHRSDVSRGAANSGRVFPPAVALGPGATGVGSNEVLTAYANSWASFLNNVYGSVPGDLAGMAMIVSTGTKAAPNTATMRRIQRVEAGNVIDVQQRRRTALPESYVRATTAVSITGDGVIGLGPNP